jgi:uncharacterized protein YeaO (DUF488 family)
VDRLWPRGIKKEKAKIDLWMKEIAPSDELRVWFSHDPSKWNEFKKRYFSELEHNTEVKVLLSLCIKKDVVFLFSAKDSEKNNATALKEYIESIMKQ